MVAGRPGLEGLVAELLRMEDAAVVPEDVAELVARCEVRGSELRPFLSFRDETYTRNLVRRSAWFDVIVLCWRPGQRTPVHDHSGQHGWVRVLRGALREELFEPAGPPSAGAGSACELVKRVPLRAAADAVVGAGPAVVAVDPVRAIHRLGNPADRGTDEVAVSLHVYSKPHDACSVFDLDTGAVARRELRFQSAPVPTP